MSLDLEQCRCSVCGQYGMEFSHRQIKHLKHGQPAKCKNCAGKSKEQEEKQAMGLVEQDEDSKHTDQGDPNKDHPESDHDAAKFSSDDEAANKEAKFSSDDEAEKNKKKKETEDNQVQVVEQPDHDDKEEENPKDSPNKELSKKERKRLKKEKKRHKKEKKKKKHKKHKKRRKDSPQSDDAVADDNATLSDGDEDEEEEETVEEEWSDDDEQGNIAVFSEEEMGNTNNAAFSDTEMAEEDADDKKKEPQETKTTTKRNDEVLAIPRKRKNPASNDKDDNNKSSSLIANVSAAQAPKGPSPAAMATAQDEEDFKDSDQEEYDDATGSVSLRALKQTILGRQIKTAQDIQDEEDTKLPAHPYTTDAKISHQLRKELACPICHECFLHPVSLLCGHSFCKECIQWWWQTSSSNNKNKTCPTCRLEIPFRDTRKLGVNTALRACVLALLGQQVQDRLEAQQIARKGEHGGAHDKGYEILVEATADAWNHLMLGSWKCRHNSVLDADDQRMQLALAVWKDATTTNGLNYNPRTQVLQVSLCVLQMEEDEVADGGFPRIVHEDDDNGQDDNHHLLVSRHGGRFLHSFVRATAVVKGSHHQIPLGRRSIQPNGIVELSLELTSPEVIKSEYIRFEHEETGVVMDLQVPPNWNDGKEQVVGRAPPKRQKSGRTAKTAVELDDDEEEGDDDNEQKEYDSDEDGSHMDHYEDDGFLAQEGEVEEDDDNDICVICKMGGDLMICDDNFGGCGKSFHIKCVNRTEVPRGDWICQDCATTKMTLDVGIEGHEFPMEGHCEICENDNVDLVCQSETVQCCGKKFHLECTKRTEFPKGDWICNACAVQLGMEVGPEGYEPPEEGDEMEEEGDEAILIEDDSPPRKRKRREAAPKDVIELEEDDGSEAAEFDSPAKGKKHIGGDSDEEEAGDEEETTVRPRSRKTQKRVLQIDDDDEDE